MKLTCLKKHRLDKVMVFSRNFKSLMCYQTLLECLQWIFYGAVMNSSHMIPFQTDINRRKVIGYSRQKEM